MLNVRWGNYSTSRNVYTFNSSTLVATGSNATITAVANGWFKFEITNYDRQSLTFGCSKSNGDPNNGTDGVLIWGVQSEDNATFPTSYIPTDGTPGGIARGADIASMTGTNFSSWYNSSEGTLYINAANVKEAKYATAFSSAIAGTPDSLAIYRLNSTQWRIYNTTQTTFNDSTDFANVALAYSVDGTTRSGFAAWKGSIVNIATDTSHIDFAYLQIGTGPKTSGQCCGHISRITYYPYRLTNAQLEALTL